MDEADHERTQAQAHAAPMDITGKVMKGWALVHPAGIKQVNDLNMWLDRGAVMIGPKRFSAELKAGVDNLSMHCN